ncbi:hypothetical protein PMAYCL1PPCAC_22228 [Pristionchus mayeri]|uniref:MOSC domain-containing protein n=1 Tax=Pristionchus mayeri TaxID=1317129 RepID=A0AAN5I4M3_9BILA|nr:hypothetical protein PMAYCL1PPCAC_22228 [Pristionchus mayeri]
MGFDDKKILLACVAGTIISYNVIRLIKAFFANRKDEWIPVGVVKNLWMFPVKSCSRQEVFSLYCDELGPRFGENRDREFTAIYEDTGVMLTARDAPRMMLIQVKVADGVLTLSTPEGESVSVMLADVIEQRIVRRATKLGLPVDGLDCGEAAAKFFTEYLEMTGIRLIYFRDDLFNGRPCTVDPGWSMNPFPKRSDPVRYVDLSPYHISTEESLKALNKEMETPISSEWFRANIVVDLSPAWDEDRWAEVRIGGVELMCYKPCTRCVLITVNPDIGVKSSEMQPLKRMREIRLAPEGPLREKHGQAPVFGINAGLIKPGYIHVGQTVYAKYKNCAL